MSTTPCVDPTNKNNNIDNRNNYKDVYQVVTNNMSFDKNNKISVCWDKPTKTIKSFHFNSFSESPALSVTSTANIHDNSAELIKDSSGSVQNCYITNLSTPTASSELALCPTFPRSKGNISFDLYTKTNDTLTYTTDRNISKSNKNIIFKANALTDKNGMKTVSVWKSCDNIESCKKNILPMPKPLLTPSPK